MEVKFLKYSMFKFMIESNTNSEMTKWLEALFAKMKTVRSLPSNTPPFPSPVPYPVPIPNCLYVFFFDETFFVCL